MSLTVGILGVPLSVLLPTDASKPLEQLNETPQALRNAGLLEVIRETGAIVKDFGDLTLSYPKNAKTFPELESTYAIIETQTEHAARQCDFLLVLGGGCTLASGTMRGLTHLYHDLQLLWFDSHADFENQQTTVSHYLGGMSLSHVVGAAGDPAILDGKQVTLLSGRGANWTEIMSMRSYGITHCQPENIQHWIENDLVEGNLYIHLDVDVLDLTSMPAVDIAYPPGITKEQLNMALQTIATKKTLRGLEMTVYNPYRDPHGIGYETIKELLTTCIQTLVQQSSQRS
ncbi:arginase family protein [Sulfoacidibacillus ferrooxidans]|uniref:Arginase n=1 Tax=Sulfoacidibacillus ferrooxidans TaxID=2005001 RepID=A0A9X1V8I7_9BACL|nr:arginase family protein [Sulfoacidibacillus ferrooxidans]MCI0183107.1 Arginase [Sulfoacidibacillus ferrooxidans]